jgi:outer membrane protein assembly factor BamB
MIALPRQARTLALVFLFAAVAWLSQGLAAPRDGTWPVFRGDAQQTGVAAGTLPAKLAELWTFKTEDAIESAVAVADGVVYVGSMDEHLYAVELAGGKQKWKLKAGPVKAPPAVANGVVYFGDLDGFFNAVGAAKGDRRWKYEAGSEIGGANFHGADVLFACHDENLYCLSSKDGKERWKFKTDGPIYGSPAIADGKTFLVGCDSSLHVIDIAKGKEERSVDLGGQTGATAAVLGQQLYVGTMRNEVQAINWKKGDVTWTFKPRRGQAFFASAAVTDKLVVVGSRDNRVYALDRAKGTAVWNFPTDGRVDSSPVIVGSKVVVGSLDGKLYVLDLTTGRQLQQIVLDGPVSASPVVVNGRVLVGTQKGTLYCLGEKK